MITAVSGVLLSVEDAEYIVGAFDEFAKLLAEQRSQPSPKLAHTMAQLRRATRKSGAHNATDTPNATNDGSSQADETNPVHDLGYATVTTAEAAQILGVLPSAVRGMAQRDPGKLGSVRAGRGWHHNRNAVEDRAFRKKRRITRYPPAPN